MPTSDWEPARDVPLPLGVVIPRHTEHDTPLVRVELRDVEIREQTGAGEWPAVITGTRNDTRVGMAFEFGAQWHDRPTDEVAVFSDEDGWWVVVEFESRSAAQTAVDYQFGEFEGYQTLSVDQTDTSLDHFRGYTDQNVTPIVPTPEGESTAVFAVQRATDYESLANLFGLHDYRALPDRKTRLHKFVSSTEEWTGENPLNRIARNLTENRE